ncbi:MAG: hypothetical protein QOG75_3696, partial [Mycobacterium sp.]|nr:hypothetical protein [Mycobacterium sp.]
MALTDEEYVAQYEASLAHWRARNRAFLDAVEHIRVSPLHEAVQAKFDSNATLQWFEVAPEALSAYDNIGLEQVISDVLQRTRQQVADQVASLHTKFMAFGEPGFDPNALGVPML